jgi:hypothetical protein
MSRRMAGGQLPSREIGVFGLCRLVSLPHNGFSGFKPPTYPDCQRVPRRLLSIIWFCGRLPLYDAGFVPKPELGRKNNFPNSINNLRLGRYNARTMPTCGCGKNNTLGRCEKTTNHFPNEINYLLLRKNHKPQPIDMIKENGLPNDCY